MKLLARIEKQKTAWIIILLSTVFFFLRLPSIIEPYWYGDEGIYEVIGQSMNQGHLLYRDIWDNKPPLLYAVYAFANGDQPTVKVFSAVIGILTVIAFFLLSQKIFNKQKISILLTSLFALLFATPLLESNIANAEDFILLPTILAGIIMYQLTTNNKTPATRHPLTAIVAGLLLGIAFLFKIVAIFDLVAFLTFFFSIRFPEKVTSLFYKKTHRSESGIVNHALWEKTFIAHAFFILLGFVVPFLVAVLYFSFNHALKDFIQAAFFGNVDYVAWKNSLFGIPQGLLIIKLLLLAVGIGLILKSRKHLSTSTVFILVWLLFALFNAYFSGRPYTHYAIVLLPSFCLFIGLLLTTYSSINKIKIFVALLILVIALNYQFHFNLTSSFQYYQNAIQFLRGHKSIESYQSYFDSKVPRDYAVANFIKTHTSPSDTVFIWGNNPQIYALAHKTPISKYTVAYHVYQNNAFNETQQVLNKKQPKYIIVLDEMQPLPFAIPLYIMRYNISGATIYERSL